MKSFTNQHHHHHHHHPNYQHNFSSASSSSSTMASLHRLTISSQSSSPTTRGAAGTILMNYMFVTPRGKTCIISIPSSASYDVFLRALLEKAAKMDAPVVGSGGYVHRQKHHPQDPSSPIRGGTITDNENNNFNHHIHDGAYEGGLGMVRKSSALYGRLVRRRVDVVPTSTSFLSENDNMEDEEDSSISSSSLSSCSSPYIESRMDGGCDQDDVFLESCTSSSINFSKLAYVVFNGKVLDRKEYAMLTMDASNLDSPQSFIYHISLRLRVCGGIDRQNRVGSKFGGGGVSSAQQSERERKDRLRQLALETVDLAKDPYLMRNHLGSYECKLCLTLHTNEGNYLAHTQGKKHTTNLAKRAAMEAKLKGKQEEGPALVTKLASSTDTSVRRVKIGRPAYDIFKSRHFETNQRCLSFQLHFPEIKDNMQPRHRFMSAFEQRVESPDRNYQYLLVAAEPYETVAFKIPNEPIDKEEGKFVTNWDAEEKMFNLTLYFVDNEK